MSSGYYRYSFENVLATFYLPFLGLLIWIAIIALAKWLNSKIPPVILEEGETPIDHDQAIGVLNVILMLASIPVGVYIAFWIFPYY